MRVPHQCFLCFLSRFLSPLILHLCGITLRFSCYSLRVSWIDRVTPSTSRIARCSMKGRRGATRTEDGRAPRLLDGLARRARGGVTRVRWFVRERARKGRRPMTQLEQLHPIVPRRLKGDDPVARLL